MNGADDLWLDIPMKGDPMRAYRIAVDTQSLNKDDNGVVIERGVRVTLFTDVHVPDEKLGAALRVLNDLNRKKVFSAAYVDTDGEVVLDWTLNVMAQGLHTEYVFDALARLDKLWREVYGPLTAAIQ
jgi:hypothetical protein